jgi:hypothetical protein
VVRVLPSDLEVREEARHEDKVEGPIAGDLVRDVDIAAARIPDRVAHPVEDSPADVSVTKRGLRRQAGCSGV